jgi:hypothetical protein
MLDRESLRRAAAARRAEAPAPEPQAPSWRCGHCGRDFTAEHFFMRHRCKERERAEELRSPAGQAAYAFYSEWMRLRRYSVPPIENFAASAYYTRMVKFARWVEKTAVPNVNMMIRFLVERDVDPTMWTMTSTYVAYLEWYDQVYPPESQFVETLDRLSMLAADHRTTIPGLWAALGPDELVRLVRRRHLSPWFLVVSTSFHAWVNTLEPVKREVVVDAVNFAAYAQKLRARPELGAELRAACVAEGL